MSESVVSAKPPCVPTEPCLCPQNDEGQPNCSWTIWAEQHAACNEAWDGECHVTREAGSTC